VQHFVENYIDIILIAAVVVAIVPTGLHLLNAQRKAKRADAARTGATPEAEPPAGA